MLAMAMTMKMVMAKSFLDFVVKGQDNEDVPLSLYSKSKAILVVNVASACGFTNSNYKELQTLYNKYHEKGLEILAFPCNQFGGQEPGSYEEILAFTQKYEVTFPIFQKIDVNGDNADPLFKYLKAELTGTITNDIKWNFTKFLIAYGNPYKRYATTTSPLGIEKAIVHILDSQNHEEL
ncbi:glutathione peroxidase [Thraustotheca clavata]|uniref:Glutathione peroxidase n=1 Tax=Thraustotheca clavata TaxID=74557 RepID=A0A1V9ZWS9_9STRA|nr:glutathione peroxidase [Thraustotheca clavata]